MMYVPEIIRKKRESHALDYEEIHAVIDGYTKGLVPDYQISALLMAIYFNGMDTQETANLLDAMLNSGVVCDFSSIKAPKVDKHSTGGVGDKVSICLAPLAASAGVSVPMISGRGLGHTGGTLDKLESIPGFNVRLDLKRFEQIVHKYGFCLIGQTDEIAPADRKLYALRDVTATVESIPLITASILSKKLAEGIDALVLDVKAGTGAFMKDIQSARKLARSLCSTARRAGCRTRALITDMNQPLGHAVGNALEVAEAVDFLKGGGPADLREITLVLGSHMLVLGKISSSLEDARTELEKRLVSGEALERFLDVVEAQGGDPEAVMDTRLLPSAPHIEEVSASLSGWVQQTDARTIAMAALELGAGRSKMEDKINPSVGIVLLKKPGEKITAGEALAQIHAADISTARRAASQVFNACLIGDKKSDVSGPVLEEIIQD